MYTKSRDMQEAYGDLAWQKAHYRKGRSKRILILVIFIAAVFVVAGIAIGVGASSVGFDTVWKAFLDLFHTNSDLVDTQRQTVWNLRLPRILAAILAGWALSNAGLLMQGVFQNPLVSP